MAQFSAIRIQALFQTGDTASTTTEKGRALEDLICYILQKVPGIEVAKRNTLNAFQTEEIDVAFWNSRQHNGLYFLPNIILVECKNWSHPLGSQEVAYFIQRLQNRGRDLGILIASNGITGSTDDLSRAHYEIAMALGRGMHVIVINRAEIEALTDTTQFVRLMKEKLCELAVSGTVFL
jgi:hypothetical protein